MLSVTAIFNEIRADDEAFRFFMSTAAKGEAQGGWENERIADLTPDLELEPRIRRHGADEEKHARLFRRLLERRGLETVEVPLDADYCMLLEAAGIGLSHLRLAEDRPLADEEILRYLAHSRVTEQRAAEEVKRMVAVFGDDRDLGPALRMIADDEENHLAYCHEELLRLRERLGGDRVDALLAAYARAELETYRRVGLDFVRRMGTLLGWPRWKRELLRVGVHAGYWIERLFRMRRMTRLRMPVRRRAMG